MNYFSLAVCMRLGGLLACVLLAAADVDAQKESSPVDGLRQYLRDIREVGFTVRFNVAEDGVDSTKPQSGTQSWIVDREHLFFWSYTEEPFSGQLQNERLYRSDLFLSMAWSEGEQESGKVTSYVDMPKDFASTRLGADYFFPTLGIVLNGKEYTRIEDCLQNDVAVSAEEGYIRIAEAGGGSAEIYVDPERGYMPTGILWRCEEASTDGGFAGFAYKVNDAKSLDGVHFPVEYSMELELNPTVTELPPGARMVDGVMTIDPNGEGARQTITSPKKSFSVKGKLSDTALGIAMPGMSDLVYSIDDGTKITMVDAPQLDFVWDSGAIKVMTNEGELSLTDHRFKRSSQGGYLAWAIVCAVIAGTGIFAWLIRRSRKVQQ